MHFHHHGLNFGPVVCGNAFEHIQLGFFHIDFQQIDAFQMVFGDDLREGFQLTFHLLRAGDGVAHQPAQSAHHAMGERAWQPAQQGGNGNVEFRRQFGMVDDVQTHAIIVCAIHVITAGYGGYQGIAAETNFHFSFTQAAVV